MKKYILNAKEKTVSFITLGCKVNQYDSDAMRTLFIKNGYKYAESNPELEENGKVQSQWQYFENVQHKRRRAYKKRL